MITTKSNKSNDINDVNPMIWTSFDRGNKYNDKVKKLKEAGSISSYKKMYPDKETPAEYRERHQRNTEKINNHNKRLQKTGSKSSISGIISLSKTMEKKPREVYKQVYKKKEVYKQVYKKNQRQRSNNKSIFASYKFKIKKKQNNLKIIM